jgi:hypothetical protein
MSKDDVVDMATFIPERAGSGKTLIALSRAQLLGLTW